jgi:hypothetical protein
LTFRTRIDELFDNVFRFMCGNTRRPHKLPQISSEMFPNEINVPQDNEAPIALPSGVAVALALSRHNFRLAALRPPEWPPEVAHRFVKCPIWFRAQSLRKVKSPLAGCHSGDKGVTHSGSVSGRSGFESGTREAQAELHASAVEGDRGRVAVRPGDVLSTPNFSCGLVV